MARDPRRDHSFSLPDPQATVDLTIPNACGRCHAEPGPAWAARRVEEWYGNDGKRRARREQARLFASARAGDPQAVEPLLSCLGSCADVVRRASAARLLARFANRADVAQALVAASGSNEALVRWNVLRALSESGAAGAGVDRVLHHAAGDAVRTVRLEAAWALRGTDLAKLGGEDRESITRAFAEWERSAAFQAEHPEVEQSRGVFYSARGDVGRAEAAYRRALELAPDAVPPRYNLALLLVERERISEAEKELVEVRRREPELAAAAYALGLIYGNTGRWREAVSVLSDCLKADPLYPGALHDLSHAYVQLGEGDVAMTVLEAALHYPGARTAALRALVSVSIELGDREAALHWAGVASGEDPELASDPRVRDILRSVPTPAESSG